MVKNIKGVLPNPHDFYQRMDIKMLLQQSSLQKQCQVLT